MQRRQAGPRDGEGLNLIRPSRWGMSPCVLFHHGRGHGSQPLAILRGDQDAAGTGPVTLRGRAVRVITNQVIVGASMFDGDYFKLMAEYNRWMNRKLYAVCAGILKEERHRDMGAFFKSIHATLDHIFFADRAWMDRFTGQPVSVRLGDVLHTDFASLQQDREKLDETIVAWVEQLDGDWLASAFEYTSNVDGKTRIQPAWVYVTHLFNHQTHHRGQVTALIKQLGYEPGITDIPWLPALN